MHPVHVTRLILSSASKRPLVDHAMDRALVFFPSLFAFEVPGNPRAEIRQSGTRLAAKPKVPFDRELQDQTPARSRSPPGFASNLVLTLTSRTFDPRKLDFN